MSNQYKFNHKTHKMSSVTANMKVGGNGFHQSSPALRTGSFSISKRGNNDLSFDVCLIHS